MSVIAEALNERKTLYTTAKTAATQLASDAIVEKKNPDVTAESIQTMLDKLDSSLNAAMGLTIELNLANNREKVAFHDKVMTLMEAIALRDSLTLQHSLRSDILNTLDSALGKGKGRYGGYYGRKTKDDVREVSLIDREMFRKELDNLAEERRLLDIEIQKVNWSAEL